MTSAAATLTQSGMYRAARPKLAVALSCQLR